MYGALNFYNACRKHDIKPILGNEVYIASKNRFQKHTKVNPYNHLTLLAYNEIGYKNLLYLTSLSFVEGLSVRPRIDMDILSKNAEGLICLSGCLSGKINTLLLEGLEAEALQTAKDMSDIFGKENFWIELQRNGINIQDKANEGLVRIAKKLNQPLIATNDIHYLRHEDCDVQDTLLCIGTGSKKDDDSRFAFDTDDVYLKSSKEMSHVFRDLPDAIRQTLIVAERANLVIPQGKPIFPKYDTDNPIATLNSLVSRGLISKYGTERASSSEILQRAEEELGVIERMGYPEYFLVVKDFCDAARNMGIPVGPGRGSAAGSIVSYALGITEVDPIKYNLIFERFLNESRIGLPDIDIDFCKARRDEVLDYIREKHGYDHVSNIITFGRLQARNAFRQSARVYDYPLSDSDLVAKKIPEGQTLDEAIDKDREIERYCNKSAEGKKSLAMAKNVEGYISHSGIHASGVVIADRPLHKIVPLARNKHGIISTQWDGEACEKIGLVKFDFLGLQTLTVIERCLDEIEKRSKTRPNLEKLEFTDSKVFNIFRNGDTEGVFQCFSGGMQKLLRDLQPTRFDDIVAALALYRPGPLESGIVSQFIDRKNGKEKVSYIHKDIEPYLSNTYGVMVYQEQIMYLAQILAGFDLKEADGLRKAVGKKDADFLASFKKKWLNGIKNTGKISETKGVSLWEDILKFGRYGFNLSHSVSYAYLAYRTAWLKHYYPVEFFVANLSIESQAKDSDKVRDLIQDAEQHGIQVVPPDLLKPSWDFSVGGPNKINMGLLGINGIGLKPAKFLESFKIDPTAGLVEIFKNADSKIIRKNTIEALIRAGALDFTGYDRGQMFNSTDKLSKRLGVVRRKIKVNKQNQGDQYVDVKEKDIDYSLENKWSETEILAAERHAFGFYLSGHPMDSYKLAVALTKGVPVKSLNSFKTRKQKVKAVGVITNKEIRAVKGGKNKGKKFCTFNLEDQNSSIKCTVFTASYERLSQKIDSAYEKATPIVLFGDIAVNRDNPEFNVLRIYDIEQDIDSADSIWVPVTDGNKEELDDLKSFCNKYKGSTRLCFSVPDEEGKMIVLRTESFIDLNTEVRSKIEEFIE